MCREITVYDEKQTLLRASNYMSIKRWKFGKYVERNRVIELLYLQV